MLAKSELGIAPIAKARSAAPQAQNIVLREIASATYHSAPKRSAKVKMAELETAAAIDQPCARHPVIAEGARPLFFLRPALAHDVSFRSSCFLGQTEHGRRAPFIGDTPSFT
jgi:hypothetical protein